ncbi:MAG TPA: aromatic ring-hydroxylating dioxygenase subunit alpha [Steroidobacteraceae bacterium]|nr:aromatic ring-hydroxylating dioxygenase subunit alpha [Steroidobacteraceae bacterium]
MRDSNDAKGPDGWIDALIADQPPRRSLEQAFYTHPAVFERDRDRILRNHWIMAGHASEIPEPGDFRLFEVAGESVILVRDGHGAIRAHYNVCRHRGSRVLLEPAGRARTMTCRYHGWTYGADGCLLSAPRMPDDFRPEQHALQPCALAVVEGLIFICLSDGPGPALDRVEAGLEPYLRLHGIASARVAHRETYAVQANWKLTVENYLECYHCKPAHPQYCGVEIKADKIGDGSPAAMARYESRRRQWQARAESLGATLPDFGTELPLDERLPQAQFGAAYRAPLRESHLSATADGRPAAPLMGTFRDYDGGETALGLGPFTYMLAYNDYATFFQFVPRAAEQSDIVVTWLVNGAAREGADYDRSRLTWLWTVTTEQDKSIIEANAAGIRSIRYAPGPSSLLEDDLDGFRAWYLGAIGPPRRVSERSRRGGGRYFGV